MPILPEELNQISMPISCCSQIPASGHWEAEASPTSLRKQTRGHKEMYRERVKTEFKTEIFWQGKEIKLKRNIAQSLCKESH